MRLGSLVDRKLGGNVVISFEKSPILIESKIVLNEVRVLFPPLVVRVKIQ